MNIPQPTTAAKAITAFITSTAGVLALFGVVVPQLDTANLAIGAALPLLTTLFTWLVPNQPKA